MRASEFSRLVAEEFGEARGAVMLSSLHLSDLGGTAQEALARGVSPREVWRALCDTNEVPLERRLGRDIPPKR
ncbi:MAG: DUF3046 domain-containing protein [Micrococcus sp.]|nr:DUF3046 domain-containing protein [Micrococcus sp.]